MLKLGDFCRKSLFRQITQSQLIHIGLLFLGSGICRERPCQLPFATVSLAPSQCGSVPCRARTLPVCCRSVVEAALQENRRREQKDTDICFEQCLRTSLRADDLRIGYDGLLVKLTSTTAIMCETDVANDAARLVKAGHTRCRSQAFGTMGEH